MSQKELRRVEVLARVRSKELRIVDASQLLQVSYRQNGALAQTALRQLNTLQRALQQTISLQGALLAQNGQLTPLELQTLQQQQNLLSQLLTSQPPPLSRNAPR